MKIFIQVHSARSDVVDSLMRSMKEYLSSMEVDCGDRLTVIADLKTVPDDRIICAKQTVIKIWKTVSSYTRVDIRFSPPGYGELPIFSFDESDYISFLPF